MACVGFVVDVRFLGSGDAFGSGGRFQTCILLGAEGRRVLLDCGATSLVAMRREGVDPSSIDAVALTHFHGDHVGGVPLLVLDQQFARRTRTLTIAGPPGVEARVRNLMEGLFPGSSTARRPFELRFVEYGAGPAALTERLQVVAFPVRHTSGAEAHGVRVETGSAAVAYTGDAEWTDALPRRAAGADLFVSEAYMFEKAVPYHLDYVTLLRHRSELRCKRMILTRLSADLLARASTLEVQAASDGLSLRV